jgi:alpha-glucoside transport system substrate-binding protein
MRSPVKLALGALALTLGTAACGGGQSDGKAAASAPGCEKYASYGSFKDAKVSVYTPIRDKEGDLFAETMNEFGKCVGIKVDYEGSGEFEAQIQVRVDGGNPPDIAIFPQPGLLARFAEAGKLKPGPAKVKELADKNWSADWAAYGTVDGTFYAAPMGANVKSLVWYSPKFFKDKGYTIPTTWAELLTLSDKIAADGVKPWCVGIESGDATGWPATDWIEDIILRELGPEGYDDWVNHKIPFNDPKVIAAMDKAGGILKNDKYVNGGYGPVKSIASTAFQEGGTPIVKDKCAMHRQGSFYANFWPEGTKIGENDDVWAFYLPGTDATAKPVLGGGDFVAAFDDRPEVQALQQYLATGDFANARMKKGTFVSANKEVDLANAANPMDKLSMQMLQDPKTVFRFDGSDLMPGSVGAGTFWKGLVDWINGKDTKSVADFIEKSWPKQ